MRYTHHTTVARLGGRGHIFLQVASYNNYVIVIQLTIQSVLSSSNSMSIYSIVCMTEI